MIQSRVLLVKPGSFRFKGLSPATPAYTSPKAGMSLPGKPLRRYGVLVAVAEVAGCVWPSRSHSPALRKPPN